jgi:anti-sigma regulatory factor (Ser/Thr protein kinase)
MAVPSWSHGTTLEATPISASQARAFVCHHLIDHRLLYLVDQVRLVVSELATNALVHGRTPFVVTLSREDHTVRLTVRDNSDWVGSRGDAEVLQTGGRGLGIVNILSRDWGVIREEGSKTVWASFDTRETEGGTTLTDVSA